MPFSFLDFLMGMFAANAIPHLIFGMMKIRFFSPFGFDSKGNLIYSVVNVCLALGLYGVQYRFETIFQQSAILGMLYLYVAFVLVGKYLYKRWN